MKYPMLALLAALLAAGGCTQRKMTRLGGDESLAQESLDKYAREHRLSKDQALSKLRQKQRQADEDPPADDGSAVDRISTVHDSSAAEESVAGQAKYDPLIGLPTLEKARKEGPLFSAGSTKTPLDDPAELPDPPLPPTIGIESTQPDLDDPF